MKKVITQAGKIAFLIAAIAQSSRQPANVFRRIDEINRQAEKIERDKMNRELKGGNTSPVDTRQTQAIKAQIKEDLEGIQFAYNQIVVNLQSRDEIDPNFIREVNAKVKKYAERLVQNIYSFLTNPIFETSMSLEIEQAKKARHDLDKIILLSNKIKENSKSLNNN
jgi:hypothetical protein